MGIGVDIGLGVCQASKAGLRNLPARSKREMSNITHRLVTKDYEDTKVK